MAENENEISKLTVKQLLAQLRVNQIWAVLGIITSLVAGAFALGYYTKSVANEVDKKELRRLEKYQSDLELKQQFLNHYLRYQIAKERLGQEHTPDNETKFEASKKIFADLIYDWWKQRRPSPAMRLHIEKGSDPFESKIMFYGDESVWPIPAEIKREVLGRKSSS